MARRWLPLSLALLAAALDASGSHGLAFHALLVAVPAAAVGALGAFGELLDLRADDRARRFRRGLPPFRGEDEKPEKRFRSCRSGPDRS